MISEKNAVMVLVMVAGMCGSTQAQHYRRGGMTTVDGPVSMTEWRQAGGNLDVYQGLMQQKAMVQQQQNYAKLMDQQQKAQQQAIKSGQVSASSANSTFTLPPAQTRARKKRHGVDESKVSATESKTSKTTASGTDKTGKDSGDEAPKSAKPAPKKP